MPKLQRLRNSECNLCNLNRYTTNVCILGRGASRADIAIVGEAPGAQEEKEGLPFVGPAGMVLDRLIQDSGLENYKYYISNVVKCKPPRNRTPETKEIQICTKKYLEEELKLVKPKIIMLLGTTAVSWVGVDWQFNFGKGLRIDREYYKGYIVITYHPAYLVRNMRKYSLVLKHFELVSGTLDFERRKKERKKKKTELDRLYEQVEQTKRNK